MKEKKTVKSRVETNYRAQLNRLTERVKSAKDARKQTLTSIVDELEVLISHLKEINDQETRQIDATSDIITKQERNDKRRTEAVEQFVSCFMNLKPMKQMKTVSKQMMIEINKMEDAADTVFGMKSVWEEDIEAAEEKEDAENKRSGKSNRNARDSPTDERRMETEEDEEEEGSDPVARATDDMDTSKKHSTGKKRKQQGSNVASSTSIQYRSRLTEEREALTKCIAKYLIRNGQFETVNHLIQEAGLSPEAFSVEESKEVGDAQKFSMLYSIMESLKHKDLSSIDLWMREQDWERATTANDNLSRLYQDLSFQFCKTKFLSLFLANAVTEAVEYARQNLRKFSSSPERVQEIQNLMGSIVFSSAGIAAGAPANDQAKEGCTTEDFPGDSTSQQMYRDALQGLRKQFVALFCNLNKIAMKSYLETCLEVFFAVEHKYEKSLRIMKYRQHRKVRITNAHSMNHEDASSASDTSSVMTETTEELHPLDQDRLEQAATEDGPSEKSTQLSWKQLWSMPHVDLDKKFRFHSVFICPICKEDTTELNPAVLLNCGHVIAKESVEKAKKPNGLIKCPTCPEEQSPEDVLILHF